MRPTSDPVTTTIQTQTTTPEEMGLTLLQEVDQVRSFFSIEVPPRGDQLVFSD